MSLANDAKLLLIPSGYKAGKVYSQFPINGGGDFTFSRTGQATRVNQGGLIETVESNVPRLDYSDGSCPALLLEPQRTNLYLNSEELSTQNVTTSASTYTVSFYGTGTITFYGSYSGSLVGLGENQRVSLTFTATVGILISTVSGSVLNAQLEQGSYPTSYIPTSGGQETRNADNCYGAGNSNLFDTTVGTMYVDITPYLSNNSPYYISMSDGSGNNRFSLFFYDSQQIRFYVIGNGGSSVNAYYAIPFNQRMKIAITFRENEFYFFVNGNLITKDTSGNIPIGLDRLNFSAYYNGAFFEGKVHEARFYNEVLSTTELATLTSS